MSCVNSGWDRPLLDKRVHIISESDVGSLLHDGALSNGLNESSRSAQQCTCDISK